MAHKALMSSQSSTANHMVLFDRKLACSDRESLKKSAVSLTRGQSAFFCNVHMLMHSRCDCELAQAMDAVHTIFPDGVPVAWLQRRLGKKVADVLRGYEAMEVICEQAAANGQSIGLFGASDKVLSSLEKHLKSKFPGLSIVFTHAPPLLNQSNLVNLTTVEAINAADPDFLFVSLGCPKQEKWIYQHRELVECAMLGVGAAFGWLAGTNAKPPGWMENVGLGWLFRLITQPRRTAKRYFIYNTQFIIASINLLLFRRK